MQPNPKNLLNILGLTTPLIGFYDAPEAEAFSPVVRPVRGNYVCIFAFYKSWLKGETLHLTKDNFGCGGAGRSLLNVESRTREELVKFLVDQEGLKPSHDLMNRWLNRQTTYRQQHPNLFIGPLRENQYPYLKTVTFLVNPDQLGALMLGAQYNIAPDDPPAVIAPIGAGCMQLSPLFEDLERLQALIGATDIAMRHFLPPDILAFTATKPMFEQLCALDDKSFLYKPFWRNLRKARGLI